jgi:hypothetical protein
MMDTTYQRARRATVGMSVLGWAALVCLLINGAFWGALMLDLLRPPSLLSPQSLQAALATVAFAIILPLFWSMLLPSSPAGRLLQRQQWATPGYVATSAAAVFLTWLACVWLRAWWAAQPNVAEAGADLLLTVSSLIAGVLVPALAWCVTTPEQWIAQIEQARHVRRIEHAMKMEEAAMRAAYARAVALLNADLTNLTIAQRRELAGILGGFARMQQHALASIAESWRDMYGVECQLATVPDQELLAGYQQVAGLLAEGADAMSSSAGYAADVRSLAAPANDPQQTEGDSTTTPRQTPSEPPMSPVATPNLSSRHVGQERTVSDSARDDDTLSLARRELSPGWTSKELAGLMRRDQRTAQRKIAKWVEHGWARDLGDGRYDFTRTREV